mmetsp:Transcript_68543/g.153602  ORF Transcript_68543/g.153602 Transcript_68543/m.153602 type:complete len:357 (-) Transcript_68543:73-1143(-)
MSYGDRRSGGSGWGDRKGGGRGWGSRFNDDHTRESEPTHQHHSLESGFGGQKTEPISHVQIDALVFLQIMKHCRQHAPQAVMGQLLGLDVDKELQVTHSFGFMQRSGGDEGAGHEGDSEQYQIDTLKRLREVNVDSNTVGWYQTTHLGQFFSSTVIETQHLYQTEIPRSVLVVYDSLQSAIGKPSFKALQLTPKFMKAYSASNEAGRQAMSDFPSSEMFMELPITVSSSAIVEAFLVDWAISDPISTTSQVGVLDVENQAFLEKNVQLLMHSLEMLAEEQNKMIMFERQAARKGDPPQKGGRDRFRQNQAQPRQLDTMVLSQQIQNYCKAINSFAGDAFGKIYLVSNKPSGDGGAL